MGYKNKLITKSFYTISVIFFSFLLVGCAGADAMLIDPSKTYSPTEYVKFILEEPEEKFEIIAIVEANGSQYNNQSEVFRAAQKKAGKIGAHAIYPLSTESREVSPHTMPNPVAGGPPIYIAGGTQMTMKFAALRFIK